ncbi:TIGR03915 family putative DNA repair protein [Aquimarina sp. ERC-38]|uniref:TIGR03915 family putative DNA repair protein n=1 Tax=Aquimarina sp. ERC-38 TaxID=2949996 RepID=UPI002246CE58|nr:TIGR03915 family putative DNA repair protein [Aquimarina sp. ERC-38]UZO81076.1 TIGR03915 family putative DNA repair protein [Aquimarina sp. ERC-38]
MKDVKTILQYDESFDGFLSCIFYIFEYKLSVYDITPLRSETTELFASTTQVFTNPEKSKRVWDKFCELTDKKVQAKVLKAFLSEIKGVENTLGYFIKKVLTEQKDFSIDYGDAEVLKIQQVAKMVHREKHRMEAFIRFQKTKDDLYVATIEPDFNVLPLILKHFESRYADQKWLIFDVKRNYGIFYDLQKVETITADFFTISNTKIAMEHLAEGELDFQKLWATYFSSVNIKSRKNNKLHLQHIPRRYWKYLTEKTIPLQ